MRIGVDLGGTKIEVAALAPDGAFLLRERHASPTGDYAKTVRAVRERPLAIRRIALRP